MKAALDKIIRFGLILFAFVIICVIAWRYLIVPAVPEAANIAHAGGMIDGTVYTNSITALDLNYDRGFRVFEIDFHKTADGHDVCSHDWDDFDGNAPDLATFLQWRESRANPPCLITELVDWFADHPDAEIVTDPKVDVERMNLKLHGLFGSRMIAQAYSAAQVCSLHNSGIERVVLTLYRRPYDYATLKQELDNPCNRIGGLWAVTMDKKRLVRGHVLIAKYVLQVPVYTHTINRCNWNYLSYLLGADAIYSDILTQEECQLW